MSSVRDRLRPILERALPRAVAFRRTVLFRRLMRRWFWPLQRLVAKTLFPDGAIRVSSGPFCGMQYFNRVAWGSMCPKWIGSYEEELHDILLDAIRESRHHVVVNIGAAEGYYAVGLAKALPNARVFSFDIDIFARGLQRALARRNGIRNLAVGGECSPDTLQSLAGRGALVLCDAEGYEYTLLDPAVVPALFASDILVEVHAHGSLCLEEVAAEVKRRFSRSHRLVVVHQRKRDLERYADVCRGLLDRQTLELALDEHRSIDQLWLWMEAKNISLKLEPSVTQRVTAESNGMSELFVTPETR